MGVGLSGMISGLDTDSIVKAMVAGQEAKKTKIDNKITINKWTTTAWSDLNKKIYSFYTDFASKLRLQSTYQTRTATSSNEEYVKVSAGTKAPIGSHKIKVVDVASSQYVTGAKVSGTYTTSSRLAAFSEDLIGQEIKITTGAGTANAKEKTLKVDQNTKVSDFLTFCKDAGINANYDTAQKRFFFSSMDSGKDNAFSISSTQASTTLTNLKKDVTGELTETELESLSSDQRTNYETAMKTITSAKKEDLDAILAPGFDVDDPSTTEAQASLHSAIAMVESFMPYTTYDVPADATEEEKTEIQANQDAEDARIEARRLAFEQKVSDLLSYAGPETEGGSLAALGITQNIDENTNVSEVVAGDMVVKKAGDATIELDGATMTSSSNTIVANGMTFTIEKPTNGQEISLTIGKDSDSTYNLVKDALKSYNELIDEMSKLYYADSARKYSPLTDEQKEAMTDEEIKNWEDKIKSALLRRDNTLGSLMSSMRSALQGEYKDDSGNTYSLSTFGIVTGNYTEYGKLHIYGDKDDGTYAIYDDRLKKALDEDPDQVMNAMSGIFSNLYSTLSEKCAKTTVSSALTFYNDKTYTSNLKSYEKDLDQITERINTLMDKYYKQFTAMEKSLSTLQSQTSSLASMLGQSTQS